jgi:hypothetical protein
LKIKMRVAAMVVAAIGVGALATPANAMNCYINNQPGLSQTCNQVIGVVCNPKIGRCG